VKRLTDADKTTKIEVKKTKRLIFFLSMDISDGNSSRPDKKQTNRVALPAAVIYYYNISVGRLLGT